MKKTTSYRLSSETDSIISHYAMKFNCTKTEVVESCIKIIFDNRILESLNNACVKRYLDDYGITMEYPPNMNMIVRESSKREIQII